MFELFMQVKSSKHSYFEIDCIALHSAVLSVCWLLREKNSVQISSLRERCVAIKTPQESVGLFMIIKHDNAIKAVVGWLFVLEKVVDNLPVNDSYLECGLVHWLWLTHTRTNNMPLCTYNMSLNMSALKSLWRKKYAFNACWTPP